MNREQIRQVIADATGNPSSGTIHDAIDAIADALTKALNPTSQTTRETRVTEPTETRDQ